MDTNGINSDCSRYGLRRKPECDTEEYGGAYQVMNLRNYLVHQQSISPDLRLTLSSDGEKRYVHLFRSCEFRDTSIIDDRGTYDDEWTKLKSGARRSSFPFMDKLPHIADERDRLGAEPGIGINVGLNISVPLNYLEGRITSDGINKLHSDNSVNYPSPYTKYYFDNYAFNYNKIQNAMRVGRAYIYELKVEISDEIMVCAINGNCTWNQITCDKKTSDEYHLIGHTVPNKEMNILAKCPYIIHKRTLYKLNLITGEPQIISEEEILNVSKSASNYRNKYLKYKNKYLELKKIINSKE